jgi:hypothetical protein
MKVVKFHEDYQAEEHVFTRNSMWEFLDKQEELDDSMCDEDCNYYEWKYRIKVKDRIFSVPGEYLVEINVFFNKDYTEEKWREFITKDQLVEDGDYVKAWIETFGINKPVKSIADQCDYPPAYKRLQKQIDEKYGNGGFEKYT